MNEKLEKEVRPIIKNMLVTIDTFQYNNGMVVGQICIDLVDKYGITLADIEELLRKLESRVRLVGLPLKLYNSKLVARRPNDETFYEYGLWVGMNGPEELALLFKKAKLSETDVDISLDKTGFLFMNNLG